MKLDLTQLLLIFDDLMPLSNEEQGVYWFIGSRVDGLVVTLVASVYEDKAAVSVSNKAGTSFISLHFTKCLEINVLDEKKKCLEILHQDPSRGRCFISLLDDLVVQYEE